MNSIKMQPVMIMAGGTGGHVYPALAVAKELISRGIPVVWMGTRKGIEARLVPDAGIEIEWLGMHGIRGKGFMTIVLAPVKIVMACIQALQILRKRNPAVVLGMGGFVSAPGGIMAKLSRTPLLIHEQNAVPGMSNKLLAKLALKVMEAFPASFNRKTQHVGNPVRDEIAALRVPEERLKDRHGNIRLFVFGGSLGAAKLNEIVPQTCAKLMTQKTFEIRHQAGPGNIDQARENYANLEVEAQVLEYVDDMAAMYDWADIVVCRAGAMTVSELAAAGVASILVPYPYAVDDHQTYNAQYLSNNEAAILIQQKDLSVDRLVEILASIDRETIRAMSVKARQLGMPESTNLVVATCLEAGGYHVN